jgi:hypothetical protein
VLARGELVQAYPLDEPVGRIDQTHVGVLGGTGAVEQVLEALGGTETRIAGAQDHDVMRHVSPFEGAF